MHMTSSPPLQSLVVTMLHHHKTYFTHGRRPHSHWQNRNRFARQKNSQTLTTGQVKDVWPKPVDGLAWSRHTGIHSFVWKPFR